MAGKVSGLISALKRRNPASMSQMADRGGMVKGVPVVSDKNPEGTEKSLSQVGLENSTGKGKKTYERMIAREKSKR